MTTIYKFATGTVLGDRQIRVIVSDATTDRVGDILEPRGCQYANFHKTGGPVLFNHDSSVLIGNAKVELVNNRIEALITFAPEGVSAKADEICGLAKAGVLVGVSVGFNALKWEPLKNSNGILYSSWEMIECSLTPIPCNPSAVVIGKSFEGNQLMTYASPRVETVYDREPHAVLGGLMRMAAHSDELRGDGRPERIAKCEEIYGGPQHPVVQAYTKSLNIAYGTSGAYLVPSEFAQTILPRLYQRTVLRKAGANVVSIPKGNLSIAVIGGNGTSITWLPSPGPVGIAQPSFGRIDVVAKKAGVVIPISNDVLRFAVDDFDLQIANMLADEIAALEDQAFIRSAGGGDSSLGLANMPMGLRGFATGAGNMGFGSVVTSNPIPSLANAVLELAKCAQALLNASVPMRKPVWILSPTVELWLRTVQNTQDLFPFAHSMDRGLLLGFPFISTANIPNNLTIGSDADCSEVYLVDADETFIFEGPEFEFYMARSGGVWTDSFGVTHAGGSEDVTLVRAVVGREFALKHAPAAAYISGVRWPSLSGLTS